MELERDIQVSLLSLKQARKQILNIIQAAYGQTPQWEDVRGMILAILGKNGLEGALTGTASTNGMGDDDAENQTRRW